MEVVILAGGFGTRISEESILKPKPMIEIGGIPILIHIMRYYSSFGYKKFILCLGYKGYLIKEYFANYLLHSSDFRINLKNGIVSYINSTNNYDWDVTLVDTGENTMTGGRLKRIKNLISTDDFHMTYGDGLSNVNLSKLVEFYNTSKSDCVVTAVQPPGRFGSLKIDDNKVTSFKEKPIGDNSWINGGFFVMNKNVLDLITDDTTVWENEPMESLARDQNLSAFRHHEFWHPMDTLRDKLYLEKIWTNGKAPWTV